MKRGKSWWQRGWAVVAALVPAASLAQQYPGLSVRPSGQTLQGPPTQDQPIDLSQPEPKVATIGLTGEEKKFIEADEAGQTWANARLAIIYVNTPDDPVRMKLGRKMLEQAADQNSSDALFELAKMALAGRGVDRSPSAAFDYMRRAAELGMPEAQYELASMYSEGRGTSVDLVVALQWAEKAAAQSHPEAMLNVGLAKLGSAEPATRANGLAMLEQAAKGGNKLAAIRVAAAYALGDLGVGKNELRAEQLLKPHADEGDAEAQFALASLYEFGESFAERRSEVRVLLQHAADQGHEQARTVLNQTPEQ